MSPRGPSPARPRRSIGPGVGGGGRRTSTNERGAGIRLAARLYSEGLAATQPLDAVVARFLRAQMHGRPDDERGFVVDTAQGMWRARALLEHCASQLPYAPTREALAALWLLGPGGLRATEVPVDRQQAHALAALIAAAMRDAPLPVRASMPAWLCERLLVEDDRGADVCVALSRPPPQTLRANALRGTREGLIAALAADDIVARPCALSPDGVVVTQRRNVFRSAAFRDGLFEVQDEGSQLVSLLCEAGAGMTVVDGCAGAGGKTLHLAARMQGKGTLTAFDVHGGRLAALRERAARAGAHNVRAVDLDEDASVRKRMKGRADVVLVDAPCTGSGVLRRNPDTSWHLQADDVTRLVQQQGAILDAYAPLVKPGGRLVYATCSLLRAEDDDVVHAFVARHPQFVVASAAEALSRQGVPVDALDGCGAPMLRLDPARHATDGFFGAVLLRTAT